MIKDPEIVDSVYKTKGNLTLEVVVIPVIGKP